MSKCIDISSKLTNEKPVIKIAEGKEYEIDNSKNTMMKVNQIFTKEGQNEIAMMDNAIEMLLGKKAFKEINEMNLSVSSYKTIFTAIMAGVSDQTYEEAEARFQDKKQ